MNQLHTSCNQFLPTVRACWASVVVGRCGEEPHDAHIGKKLKMKLNSSDNGLTLNMRKMKTMSNNKYMFFLL